MKYKLSRKLSASERASLKEAHASLGKALAAFSKARKTIAGNERKLKKMEARAAVLEKQASRGSLAASTELAGVKDQIARVLLATSESVKRANDGRSIKVALGHAIELVRAFCVENLSDQIRDLFEERLADFYFDEGRARGIATDCDALTVLWNAFRVNPYSSVEGDVSEAGKFSEIINQLLKGEAFWEFPPSTPRSTPASKSKSR